MATALENQFESWRLRLHDSSAGQFYRWWVDELKQMLPAGIRGHLLQAGRRVVVQVDEHELDVSFLDDGGMHQLEIFQLDQDVPTQQQQIRDLLHERELHEVPRELLLPEEDLLRKEVTLPLAAENNIRQALSFEMDRQTPFQAGQVYFDYRVIHRDREAAQMKLDLVVCLKEIVDKKIALLNPRGMSPTGVDAQINGVPAGLNLLPREMRYRMTNQRARINRLLGLCAVVLLAVVMAQSLWLRDHQIQKINDAIDEVRMEARQVQNIRDQINDATEAAGFMMTRRAETQPTIGVLAEVTRTLPDDTYLDRIRVWSGSVQMQGKSDNAQRLIEVINDSEMLENASFRGPTRRDARTGKEIFDLNADMIAGEAEENAADS